MNYLPKILRPNPAQHIHDKNQGPTKRFKAILQKYKDITTKERCEWNRAHCDEVFEVCQQALSEYRKTKKDSGRACEIIDTLTKLCQDIPDKLRNEGWKAGELGDLIQNCLDYRTDQAVRMKGVTFVFVAINGAKDKSPPKYIENLRQAIDFTPFCEDPPYNAYEKNFKKELIIAKNPLRWIREGSAKKEDSLEMLSRILSLVKEAEDFNFWYNFIVLEMYPILFHNIYHGNRELVKELDSDDEKKAVFDVEFTGFGTMAPPPRIHSIIVEWLCGLLNNNKKCEIICKTKLHMAYLMEILQHSVTLPVTTEYLTMSRILWQCEKWILGISLTKVMIDNIQDYYQIMTRHLYQIFQISGNEKLPKNLDKKLNLCAYTIYLFRLLSGEPYVNLASQTWEVLLGCLMNGITQLQAASNDFSNKVLERLVHPLIHCLFKTIQLCSISDPKTANILWERLTEGSKKYIQWEPFVIEWRESIRGLTVEMLSQIAPAHTKRPSKNLDFRDGVPPSAAAMDARNRPTFDGSSDKPFDIETSMSSKNVDICEFGGLEMGFTVWDRLLHLLSSPEKNKYDTRYTHLEGFTDSIKLFVIAMSIRPPPKADQHKREARKNAGTSNRDDNGSGNNGNSSHNNHNNNDSNGHSNNNGGDGGSGGSGSLVIPKKINGSLYGFAYSALPFPIDVTNIRRSSALYHSRIPLPSREQLPQGDTLVTIFGPWLFQVCEGILGEKVFNKQIIRAKEFALAFSSLANIFFTRCEQPFKSVHLAEFYKLIKLGLNKETAQTLRAIVIRECRKGCIFGKDLDGVRILIPDFLVAINQGCGLDYSNQSQSKGKLNSKLLNEQEALDCLHIALSLMCHSSHFEELKVESCKFEIDKENDVGDDEFEAIVDYSQIKPQLADLFARVLYTDHLKLDVIHACVHGLCLTIFDEVSSSQNEKLISNSLRALVDATTLDKPKMAMIATDAIECLATICDDLCKIKMEFVSNLLFPQFLKNNLDYVRSANKVGVAGKNNLCQVATAMIYCAVEWIFKFPPQLLIKESIVSVFFQVLHQTIALDPYISQSPELGQLVLAGKTSKIVLFNYLNNFPLKHDSGAITSNATDINNGNPQDYVFLAYDNNTLITVNDRSIKHCVGSEAGVRLLLRDESGRFAWNFTPCSLVSKPRPIEEIEKELQEIERKERQLQMSAQQKKEKRKKSHKSHKSKNNKHESGMSYTSIPPPPGAPSADSASDGGASPHNNNNNDNDNNNNNNNNNGGASMNDEELFEKQINSWNGLKSEIESEAKMRTQLKWQDEELLCDDLKSHKPFEMEFDDGSKDVLSQVLDYIDENEVNDQMMMQSSSASNNDSNNNNNNSSNDAQSSNDTQSQQQQQQQQQQQAASSSSSSASNGAHSRFNSGSVGLPNDGNKKKIKKRMDEQMREEQELYDENKETRNRVLLANTVLGTTRKKSLQQSKSSPTNSGSNTPVFASIGDDSSAHGGGGDATSNQNHGNNNHSHHSNNNNKLSRHKQLTLTVDYARKKDRAEEHMSRHTLPQLTAFDRSRFLLSHLGILPPGRVLDIKDSCFSYLMDDDSSSLDGNSMNGKNPYGSPQQMNSHSARLLTNSSHDKSDHPSLRKTSSNTDLHSHKSHDNQNGNNNNNSSNNNNNNSNVTNNHPLSTHSQGHNNGGDNDGSNGTFFHGLKDTDGDDTVLNNSQNGHGGNDFVNHKNSDMGAQMGHYHSNSSGSGHGNSNNSGGVAYAGSHKKPKSMTRAETELNLSPRVFNNNPTSPSSDHHHLAHNSLPRHHASSGGNDLDYMPTTSEGDRKYELDRQLLFSFANTDAQFVRRLGLFDTQSFSREKHKIAIVYCAPDQDDQRYILGNENGSLAYSKFLSQIGWLVDLSKHEGFNAGLDASVNGQYSSYYASPTFELMFHVATLMPTKAHDNQHIEKVRHIGNDHVKIIWTDHLREYIPGTIAGFFKHAHIVIYPLKNGMYRIAVHKMEDVARFGPIIDGMILREHLLAPLIRLTALQANRTVRYANATFTRPYVERKKYLDEAIERNVEKDKEALFNAFFPNKK